jgi:branched-chain amino acid transport system ATP-binding protein
MTVRANSRVGAYILDSAEFEERKEYVYDLYPDLAGKRSAKAGSLSGGQQTMLSFGMALMNDPDLIMLDEPSAGLAPELVEQMFELIEQLRDEGIPFLIIEQSVRFLLDHTDYVYVIDDGTIKFEGEPEDIRSREDLMGVYLALET